MKYFGMNKDEKVEILKRFGMIIISCCFAIMPTDEIYSISIIAFLFTIIFIYNIGFVFVDSYIKELQELLKVTDELYKYYKKKAENE